MELTRRIWDDMRNFKAYISHELLFDINDRGHLLVVSKWSSREEADRIRDEYSNAEPVRLIEPMLLRPRKRMVFGEDKLNLS